MNAKGERKRSEESLKTVGAWEKKWHSDCKTV